MPSQTNLSFSRSPEGDLLLHVSGDWRTEQQVPSVEVVDEQLTSSSKVLRILFDTKGLKNCDSGFFDIPYESHGPLFREEDSLGQRGTSSGTTASLSPATAIPERKGARKKTRRELFLSLLGGKVMDFYRSASKMVNFIGEAAIALSKLLEGKATFKRSDLFLLFQECGAQALPIVSLISILGGPIR